VAELESGASVRQTLGGSRHGWVQVLRGRASVNGEALEEGDGAAITGETEVTLAGCGAQSSEVLLFDLP